MSATRQLAIEGELPSFGGATEWINSEPLSPSALRGKVVLVEFWTFTCINWIRTLPYVRAWADRYADAGLVTIGVHTPEFEVEHDLASIRRAAAAMDVRFPVAVDNDFAVWRAFHNRYWPAMYFVDANGSIRHHQFGEGDYERSELVIRQLLEATGAGVSAELASVHPSGVEAQADWSSLGSPEAYVGYDQADNFASPGGLVPGEPSVYEVPTRLSLNEWAFGGDWTVEGQPAALNGPDGRIVCRFHARDVHLVMGPPPGGGSVQFRVLLDGRPPQDAHGVDIDGDGNGTITDPRLYQLIRQAGGIEDRTFEIQFLDPGARGYVFTFG